MALGFLSFQKLFPWTIVPTMDNNVLKPEALDTILARRAATSWLKSNNPTVFAEDTGRRSWIIIL